MDGERQNPAGASGKRASLRLGAALLALVLGGCAAEAAAGGEGASSGLTAQKQGPASGCVARPAGELPAKLSQLGGFDGEDPRWPAPSTIAFSVNAPLWTDGAEKERFMALPEGARIELDERGDFVLPVGSVLVKSFLFGATRVETRVLMHDATEGWHGASYAGTRTAPTPSSSPPPVKRSRRSVRPVSRGRFPAAASASLVTRTRRT